MTAQAGGWRTSSATALRAVSVSHGSAMSLFPHWQVWTHTSLGSSIQTKERRNPGPLLYARAQELLFSKRRRCDSSRRAGGLWQGGMRPKQLCPSSPLTGQPSWSTGAHQPSWSAGAVGGRMAQRQQPLVLVDNSAGGSDPVAVRESILHRLILTQRVPFQSQ